MNCDANSGNMQHYFVELRGIGHDKSAPTAGGMNVGKYAIH